MATGIGMSGRYDTASPAGIGYDRNDIGDDGMTPPKPGSFKVRSIDGPGVRQLGPTEGLGDDLGDDNDWYKVSGNPDKGILGGDNRTDLGLFRVPGQAEPNGVMGPKNFAWPGDAPLFDGSNPGANPDPMDLKSWFRRGSDTLGLDSRIGGY